MTITEHNTDVTRPPLPAPGVLRYLFLQELSQFDERVDCMRIRRSLMYVCGLQRDGRSEQQVRIDENFFLRRLQVDVVTPLYYAELIAFPGDWYFILESGRELLRTGVTVIDDNVLSRYPRYVKRQEEMQHYRRCGCCSPEGDARIRVPDAPSSQVKGTSSWFANIPGRVFWLLLLPITLPSMLWAEFSKRKQRHLHSNQRNDPMTQ